MTFLNSIKETLILVYNFLFRDGPYLPKKDCTGDFTLGEPDENSIARVYRNGQPTQITMLVFSADEVEKLKKYQDELEKNNKNE